MIFKFIAAIINATFKSSNERKLKKIQAWTAWIFSILSIIIFDKRNNPHFLWVNQQNEPTWEVRRALKKLVRSSPLSNDSQAFSRTLLKKPSWAYYTGKTHRKRSLVLKSLLLHSQAKHHSVMNLIKYGFVWLSGRMLL